MISVMRTAAVAAAAVFGSALPAAAAVYFHVEQTGPILYTGSTTTAPVHAEVLARFALREDKLAEGYSVSVSNFTYGVPAGVNLHALGIDGFYLDIVRVDANRKTKVFEILQTDFLYTTSAYFNLSIGSIPDGLPNIYFSWQDQDGEIGVAFRSVDSVVTGDVAWDLPIGPDFGVRATTAKGAT